MWALFFVEATAGFEPANQGFAGPCLPTWLRRRGFGENHRLAQKAQKGKKFLCVLRVTYDVDW